MTTSDEPEDIRPDTFDDDAPAGTPSADVSRHDEGPETSGSDDNQAETGSLMGGAIVLGSSSGADSDDGGTDAESADGDNPASDLGATVGDIADEPRVDDEPSDEELVDDLVGDLFRDVDDRFSRLERQYLEAREELTPDAYDQAITRGDPVAASAARFELVEEIATLRADVERQAAELDERDRMLGELSERLLDFETRHRAAGQAAGAAESLRQQLHDEHRELTRVQALLDASLVEREELSSVAQRMQQDNDELEQRLSLALERFDEVEQSRSSLADGVAQLEAAREAESADHEQRQEELHEARAEIRRLTETVDELNSGRDEAVKRADRVEHDVERRANEIGYLNRRIDTLTERANESDALDAQVRELTGEQALLKRRISDLERELEAKTAEAAAASRAVESLADRTSQHDALLMRVRQLESAAATPRIEPAAAPAPTSELQELASRARALGEQRSSDDYEPLGVESIVATSDATATSPDLSHLPPPPPPPVDDGAGDDDPAPGGGSTAPQISVPQISVPQIAIPDITGAAVEAPNVSAPQIEIPTVTGAETTVPQIAIPGVESPAIEVPLVGEPADVDATVLLPPPPVGATPIEPPTLDGAGMPFTSAAAPEPVEDTVERRRLVLPAEMNPDTTEAVDHILSQPRLTAIVDARSVCARAGIRPSELFVRLEALRDRYDLPIEVVVTPVSTPVSGAPDLPAIGVHQVTGADTVSDRVRALCIGFPADEQLVVIAGDDHVRRAAIGQEANIVDPAVALGLV